MIHLIPPTSRAEALRQRRARVARSLTRAKLGARRAHAAQEPTGARLAYTRGLQKLVAELWGIILSEYRETIEQSTVRGDDLRGLRPLGVADRVKVKLYDVIQQKAPELVKTAGDDVSKHNAKEMKRLVGIDPKMDPGTAPFIDQFRRENVRLITSIADEQLDRVEQTIKDNFGVRVEALSKKLEQEFDVTKSRANLIARDQTLKLNGQLTRVRQQNSGISEYVWTTSNDERVRGNPAGKYPDSDPSHYERDGKQFRWDTPPEGGHPGEDFQCRCTAYPVVPGLDEGGEADE